MTRVPIRLCSSTELFPLLAEYERQMDEVHRRAYHLFEQRGGTHGRALDDWLKAERQILCLPQALLTEEEDAYHVVTALSAFTADQIQISISPNDMVIRAETTGGERIEASFKAMTQYRFRRPIDITRVTANFDDGLLRVEVPKQSAGETNPKGNRTT